MGRKTKLRDLVGALKDKASQSRAAILSKPNTQSLHLALLRATTHDPYTPPNHKHLVCILSFGYSSRATASAAVEALMDRLQNTHDASVALKCVIAVHHIIKFGSFILQDQLSVYPSNGGRNYLKLSNFRDSSNPLTWELSSWVRWYAQYVENHLFTSRILGFFLGSSSCTAEKDKEEERVTAIPNSDLIRETESLIGLLENFCKQPDSLDSKGNKLVNEIKGLVGEDQLSAMNEISIRANEFGERLSCLSYADSFELACALKRLEDCRERMAILFQTKKDSTESFWDLIMDIREKVEREKEGKELRLVKKDRASESARFRGRVMSSVDSVKFSSGRLAVNYNFSLPFVGFS
ncbi:hypothetical protein UlMin_038742 [Ulmus minor]